MLSSSFDIGEFIDKVKGHSDQEIIYMADQEATQAERHLYKHCNADSCDTARSYVLLLKDIVMYMRHGIQTRSARMLDLTPLQAAGRDC